LSAIVAFNQNQQYKEVSNQIINAAYFNLIFKEKCKQGFSNSEPLRYQAHCVARPVRGFIYALKMKRPATRTSPGH
jgi:hypothetical protein